MIDIFNILIATNDNLLEICLTEFYSRKQGINVINTISGAETLYIIDTRSDIHLFFIDTKLKDMDGFSLAKRIRATTDYSFAYIIFMTEKINHIITAFKEFHCYDYFVKPLNIDEIYEVTYKLINHITDTNNINTGRPFVTFSIKKNVQNIYVDRICFIEKSKQKCLLYVDNNKVHEVLLPLNKILETVSSYGIIQTHRSFAVNPSNISFINKSTQPWEIMFYNCTQTAYISRKYRNIVLDIFENKK